MFANLSFQTLVIVWLAVAIFVLARRWRHGRGVGLMFTYVLSFAAMHWIASVVYLIPWYLRGNLELTTAGLRESTVGIIALAVGSEFAAASQKRHDVVDPPVGPRAIISPLIVNMYLVGGLAIYGVIAPLGSRIPSVAGLLSTGSSVIVAGLGLKCWNSWQTGHRPRMWGWLLLTLAFPLVTVVAQGFLGFGFAAMLIVFAFVASFSGPKPLFLVAGLLSWYIGLSVYVTYMRDRTDIRKVVWTGASLENRLDRLSETFTNMEWFSFDNERHLYRVDARLNQNFLLGAAVANLEPGYIRFAHGATIGQAALAIIPRALWPEKPMMAGSGELVSIYTGFRFPTGTSVGIGHVMECYVNFGTAGVAVGFFLIGALLTLVDIKAVRYLQQGDAARFTSWYLPGLSLLLIGGSFIEMTSSAAAAALMAFLFNRVGERLSVARRLPLPVEEAAIAQ